MAYRTEYPRAASCYRSPGENDVADAASFLRWFHETMQQYVRNEIDWQDARAAMLLAAKLVPALTTPHK